MEAQDKELARLLQEKVFHEIIVDVFLAGATNFYTSDKFCFLFDEAWRPQVMWSITAFQEHRDMKLQLTVVKIIWN